MPKILKTRAELAKLLLNEARQSGEWAFKKWCEFIVENAPQNSGLVASG